MIKHRLRQTDALNPKTKEYKYHEDHSFSRRAQHGAGRFPVLRSRNLPDICAEKIAESRIDGVILIHTDSNAEWVDRLLRVSSNVVAIDQPADQLGLSRIVFDNRAAIELAVKTLTDLGHHRIGFIADCTTEGCDSILREKAFVACGQQGLIDPDPYLIFNRTKCIPRLSIDERYCELEGERGFRYLMSLPEPPTAISAPTRSRGAMAPILVRKADS